MRRRLTWPAIFGTVTLLATIFVIGPGALAWRRGFMAWPPPYDSAIPVGDHLQMTYFLWLWTHALETRSHWPWHDPFQFAATGTTTYQPFGWPLALVFVPVDLLFGPVAAYNTLLLLSFPASAIAAYLFARELGASRAASAVAGFAFAFAPFRIVRAATHVTALLSPLVPLAFLCAERAFRRTGRSGRRAAWAFGLVYVSLLGSGDLQLALSTTVLLVAYALPSLDRIQPRERLAPALVTMVASVAVAALMYAVLASSVAGEGRSIADRLWFGPRLGDLMERQVTWLAFERYAYPGAGIATMAVVGAIIALRGPRRRQALGLVLATLVGFGLALAPASEAHPTLTALYDVLPLFRYSRTPGRIFAVSTLPLAVLAGFAMDAIRRRSARALLSGACMMLIVCDGPSGIFRWDAARPRLLAAIPRGATVLHLPAFDPGDFSGSPYLFLTTRIAGPMPNGYSPYVSPGAKAAQATSRSLGNPPPDPCQWRTVSREMGIQYVAVHRGLYGQHELQWHADPEALITALDTLPGFTRLPSSRAVAIYRVAADRIPCPNG